ncbi:MAG TPA: polysaccharide biosynthesis C-terminal domain-containing protein [Chitinophagaceae bacterium]|nr:polysaccharide biosynthesis C-terminal domain-containing protein [Chitinophagaceae bacterium]
MKFKQVIFSGIFWRGLYFATVLLLNIIVSRYFQAKGSGWIYYITNYFSLIILVASLSLESGMTYFGSKHSISANRLATFSLVWSTAVTGLIVLLLFLYYNSPEQEYSRNQFIFFAFTYTSGVLLTSFFCALFYAQQNYALPNTLLALTNILLVLTLFFSVNLHAWKFAGHFFLQLYFFNYLLQGIILSAAYLIKNKIWGKWSLPGRTELKLLFRYSLFALFNNLIFFLLYRIDYWFVKNICKTCIEGDLGNYIQVSKIGQMFLLLPVIIASAIFPLTASGFRNEINNGLPVLARAILLLYLIILGFLAITGQWLFPWVYGETFERMYLPFILLIPGILSLSTIALLTAYNSGKNKMAINMKGSLIGLVVIVAGDWLLIPKYGIAAAAVVSSAGYISYLSYLLYVFKKEYNIAVSNFFIPVRADWQRLQQILSSHEAN